MKRKSSTKRCAACQRAHDLIEHESWGADAGFPTRADLIATLPLMLEKALAHILSEVNYDKEKDTPLGTGAHLLAEAAARMSLLRNMSGLK